jgi:hypothetical protein
MVANTIVIIYRTTSSLTDLYYRLLDLETFSFSNQTLLLDKSANIQGLNELLRCRQFNATSHSQASLVSGTIECFLFFEANYFKELVFTYSFDQSKQFQIGLSYSNSYNNYLNNIYEDVTWSDQYVLVQTVRLAVTDQVSSNSAGPRNRMSKPAIDDPITDPNDYRSIMIYLRGSSTPYIYKGIAWTQYTEECSMKTTILPTNNNTFFIMGAIYNTLVYSLEILPRVFVDFGSSDIPDFNTTGWLVVISNPFDSSKNTYYKFEDLVSIRHTDNPNSLNVRAFSATLLLFILIFLVIAGILQDRKIEKRNKKQIDEFRSFRRQNSGLLLKNESAEIMIDPKPVHSVITFGPSTVTQEQRPKTFQGTSSLLGGIPTRFSRIKGNSVSDEMMLKSNFRETSLLKNRLMEE